MIICVAIPEGWSVAIWVDIKIFVEEGIVEWVIRRHAILFMQVLLLEREGWTFSTISVLHRIDRLQVCLADSVTIRQVMRQCTFRSKFAVALDQCQRELGLD